jgi:hypothetical protein
VDSEGLGLGKFCGARVWENSVELTHGTGK